MPRKSTSNTGKQSRARAQKDPVEVTIDKPRATTKGKIALELTESDLRVLHDEINQVIIDTCMDKAWPPEDLKPTQWVYCLLQIADRIFKPRPELIRQYNVSGNTYDRGNLLLDNIYNIYNIYYNLCYAYNKIINVNQFFKMLGLDNTYPYVWESNGRLVSSNNLSLLKIIKADAEQSLASVMLGGKDNPVKYLALGNHYYGWNERRIEKDTRERRTLSLEELPKYELEKKSDNLQLPNFDDDDD